MKKTAIGKLLCRIGWHKKPYALVETDGIKGICNTFRCERCGFVGMIDSQGNLF